MTRMLAIETDADALPHPYQIFANPSLASISTLIESDLTLTASNAPGGDGDDDDKKSRRRELIRKLVGKVLMYHAVPLELDAVHVGENSTLETVLTAEDGSFGGLARRIKVKKSLLPPCESPLLCKPIFGRCYRLSCFLFLLSRCLRSRSLVLALGMDPRRFTDADARPHSHQAQLLRPNPGHRPKSLQRDLSHALCAVDPASKHL